MMLVMTKEEFLKNLHIMRSDIGATIEEDKLDEVRAREDVYFVVIDTESGSVVAMLPHSILLVDGLTQRIILGNAAEVLAEICGEDDEGFAADAKAFPPPLPKKTPSVEGLKKNSHVDKTSGWMSFFKNPLNAGKR